MNPSRIIVAAVLLAGCTRRNIVECEDPGLCTAAPGGECRTNPVTGNPWCAYPDAACPSGFRWGDATVGDDLAGTCIGGDSEVDAAPCEQQISWLRSRGSFKDLWLSSLDGTGQRLVNADVMDIGSGAEWSPAGDRVAYVAQNALWIMNADGSSPHPITNPNPGTDSLLAWSPDGTTLAYSHCEASCSIASVASAGGAATPLTAATNDRYPAWSPDGSKIVFVSSRTGDNEIYVMDANGFNETNISNSSTSSEVSPQWSPDGSAIMFQSDRNATVDLWLVDPTGFNPRSLNASALAGRWFPDGSKIVYRQTNGLEGTIHVMNSDGTGQHMIISGPDELNSDPVVSPDGSLVAFVQYADIKNPNQELWIANIDGTGRLRITNDPEVDGSPSWPVCQP